MFPVAGNTKCLSNYSLFQLPLLYVNPFIYLSRSWPPATEGYVRESTKKFPFIRRVVLEDGRQNAWHFCDSNILVDNFCDSNYLSSKV